jgi:hypothetical protein
MEFFRLTGNLAENLTPLNADIFEFNQLQIAGEVDCCKIHYDKPHISGNDKLQGAGRVLKLLGYFFAFLLGFFLPFGLESANLRFVFSLKISPTSLPFLCLYKMKYPFSL